MYQAASVQSRDRKRGSIMRARLITCLVFAFIVMGVVMTGCGEKESGSKSDSSSSAQSDVSYEAYAEVSCKRAEYSAALGSDNLYPDYIYLYESNRQLQGQSEKDAEKDAVEACIRTEALYKKAIDAGYQMSDDELDTYINNEIKAAKESQQYDAMEKIYEKSGRTYSEVMKENKEIYMKTTAIGQ